MGFYNPGPRFSFSSGFGVRNLNIPGASKFHKGNDYGARAGTPIPAAEDGKVIHVDTLGTSGWGRYIVIKHQDGTGKILGYTLYAHMSETKLNAGDTVKKGETVGKVGEGGVSSGPHLHFEVRPADPNNQRPWNKTEPVNPSTFKGFGDMRSGAISNKPMVTVGDNGAAPAQPKDNAKKVDITRLDLLDPVTQQKYLKKYPDMIRPLNSRNNIGGFLSGETLRRDGNHVLRIKPDGSQRGYFISE